MVDMPILTQSECASVGSENINNEVSGFQNAVKFDLDRELRSIIRVVIREESEDKDSVIGCQ
jgi:hypothetical protein